MTYTEIGLIVVGAIAFLLEMYALLFHGKTESQTIRQDGLRWRSWPALFGVLPGHFFTPKPPWGVFSWGQDVTLILLAVVVATDFTFRKKAPLVISFFVAVFFLFVGAVLWNQG